MIKAQVATRILICLLSITATSCSKNDSKVCTDCTASANGQTTMPAQYCGNEDEVKSWETQYINNNKLAGATAKCVRK